MSPEDRYDLVVVGGGLAGLSAAVEAREAGLERVLVLTAEEQVILPEVVGHHALEVRYQVRVRRIRGEEDGAVVVGDGCEAHGAAVVVAEPAPARFGPPPFPVPEAVADRFHLGSVPIDPRDLDVLVVGGDEVAVEWTVRLAEAGAGVVLALGGASLERFSRLGRRMLFRLEAERRAAVYWRSTPAYVDEVDGYPLAFFEDRRTPDLLVDHIVYGVVVDPGDPDLAAVGIRGEGIDPDRVWRIAEGAGAGSLPVRVVAPAEAWEAVRRARFPHLASRIERPRPWRPDDEAVVARLRERHYNATITRFDRTHGDLWIVRVRPDHGDTSHLAGQYASLGLGYWETRVDSALEPDIDRRWNTMVRRSYSISSPIFDEHGYLVDACRADELEFYIVRVPPSARRVPAFTPRLALKRAGDRVYLGPRVAGRYTLAPVNDPSCQVVFLATGTGEAPHNAMIAELFRKGHEGPVVSVVSVRHLSDLGYLEAHRRLEGRFPNYHYLPLTTREPGPEGKLYVQDILERDLLEERFGIALDPARTHVYLCGNPLMIGLPEWTEAGPVFPEPRGACEVLAGRGFTIDRRGVRGNVHYEEYW